MKSIQPLLLERPALEQPRLKDLDDEGNAALSSAESAEVELSLESRWPLSYRAQSPLSSFLHSLFESEGSSLLPVLTTARQSRNEETNSSSEIPMKN